ARETSGVAFRAIDRLGDRTLGVIVRLGICPKLVIPEESLPLVAKVPIRADRDIPVAETVPVACLEVILVRAIVDRTVRFHYFSHHQLRRGIDPARWDDVAREWLACDGSRRVRLGGVRVVNRP